MLSRATTVSEFPVRISAKVKLIGGSGPVLRKVYFELDGQRHVDKTVQIRLLPDGEATVDFEHRFSQPGSHLVSLILDDDPLPGDNRSDAVVVVQEGIPILLVDGDPRADQTESETHFLKVGLGLSPKDVPWFKVQTISWQELDTFSFDGHDLILLANVPRVSDATAKRLYSFVESGGGVVIAPGNEIEVAGYASLSGKRNPFFACSICEAGKIGE